MITGTGARPGADRGHPASSASASATPTPDHADPVHRRAGPACSPNISDVIDPFIEDEVRTGNAQMIFKNFSLGAKEVTLGGIAVEAAAAQDHGWQYGGDVPPQPGRGQGVRRRSTSRRDRGEHAAVRLGVVTEWRTRLLRPRQPRRRRTTPSSPSRCGSAATAPRSTCRGRNGSELLQDSPSREEIDAAIERQLTRRGRRAHPPNPQTAALTRAAQPGSAHRSGR